MTTAELLGWISAAMLLQVLLAVVVARASHARRGIADTEHCARCHRGGGDGGGDHEGHGGGDD